MNIDRIEIDDNGLYLDIYPKDKYYLCEEFKYPIDNKKIKEFIRIIGLWDKNYYSDIDHDGMHYTIKIYYDGKIDTYKGVRSGPLNYSEFSKFVRGLYVRK